MEIHELFVDKMLDKTNFSIESESGKPTRQEWQIWNGSDWENDWAMENEFGNGKIQSVSVGQMRTYYYTWSSNPGWVDAGLDEYWYDDQGNLVLIEYWFDGQPSSRNTFIGPFTNGQPSERIDEFNAPPWTNNWRYLYTYDANGCLIDEVMQMWDNGAWVNFGRIQYYLSQGCCPDRWVFSWWTGGSWEIYYMAMFTYGYMNCMTDLVPFAPLPYLCNPTLVTMGPTTDGMNMSSEEWRDELTYTNCRAMTYLSYYLGALQFTIGYTYNPWVGKLSNSYDNANERLTIQTTQVPSGNNMVNSSRTWYSYEGLEMAIDENINKPFNFSLEQNYPNPFNPTTTISFNLHENAIVKIKIYNMLGELVRDLISGNMSIGENKVIWDGQDNHGKAVSDGLYFYNIDTGNYNSTKKMVLMK